MPASMQASDEPMPEAPTVLADSGAFQRSAIMCTQRRSISAVCGYSSLSIMFLSMHRSMSAWTWGSSHVWQNVARFWRELPSSMSSSWTAWKASSGAISSFGKRYFGIAFERSWPAKIESSRWSRIEFRSCRVMTALSMDGTRQRSDEILALRGPSRRHPERVMQATALGRSFVTMGEPSAANDGARATVDDRVERGRRARTHLPRTSHGDWAPASDRPDPIAILEQQGTTRVADLVPIRYGRMAASAFAFYRGAAAVMAADLGARERSGLHVQLCGDAHLANFGGFASPERSFVFDINDFDETHPGPFEWDVERLAASFEIAGRSRSFSPKERSTIVLAAVKSYRQGMRTFAGMSNLDIWYASLDVDGILQRWGGELGGKAVKILQRSSTKAESKDRLKARSKLTRVVDGDLQFISDPPLLVPVEEVFSNEDRQQVEQVIHSAFRLYRRTLASDRRHLLERYELVHLARKVVGVGSVGTRSWVALLVGRDQDDPLFLQIKEAEGSVIEPYAGKSQFANHGQRVVTGQRLMQAASDIFLGWQHVVGEGGIHHDYYMRQLWDWKASADLETMGADVMGVYAQLCGWTLARGHARSGDAISIGSYLGRGDTFDQAIADFARAYADQNELDHSALVDAIASGRVTAQLGI